ncbi:hypothetical protein OQA88_12424 [Cercophora sp. LCS_1]
MPRKPLILLGAGPTALTLCQYLAHANIPFKIYERSSDLETHHPGWGLTLHWSLPALRQLLPDRTFARLPETYVDRVAVQQGEVSRFPFYDLTTGKLEAATPAAGERDRIRVERGRFRGVLSGGVDVKWGKKAVSVEEREDGVLVRFEDGEEVEGEMVVACDGGGSVVRRQLFPDRQRYEIPVRVVGCKVEYTEEEMEGMRVLDKFFLQGTASGNDTYVYLSVLDAPGNRPPGERTKYTCQVIVSWPVRDGFFGKAEGIPFPSTSEEGVKLIKMFASTWAEPFRSMVSSIPDDTEIKCLSLYDWVPPREPLSVSRIALLGDAYHPMSMYRGEGANHAILDVLDFVNTGLPSLCTPNLPTALATYHRTIAQRTRPAVLASRQACIDAHNWPAITSSSPLLSRRAPFLDFDDSHAD